MTIIFPRGEGTQNPGVDTEGGPKVDHTKPRDPTNPPSMKKKKKKTSRDQPLEEVEQVAVEEVVEKEAEEK